MYLFVHYICFYSNLFGFETKVIPEFIFLHVLILILMVNVISDGVGSGM